jgi:hypothetical protein
MPTDKEGIVRLHASGRWAVCQPGRELVEIDAGDAFRIEVPDVGGLQLTAMAFRRFTVLLNGCDSGGQAGEYFSTDRYHLRDGLRAAIVIGEEG